jgi:citrate lyase subunit beta/citryl-CoA lyase
MALRSIVTIGNAGAGLEEALASAADGVLLTLATDARPVGALRNTAIEALQRTFEAGKQGLVVVNHPRTQLVRDDLDAIVGSNLSGVLLPHAVDTQDVRDVAVLLREFELNRGMEPGAVAIFPMIDTAMGLLRAAAIAEASPRVGGLVFASTHYAHDIRGRAEEKGPRLAYARGAVVAASRAFDQQPLVIAEAIDLLHLAQYGFAGAILPDSHGVGSANAAFTPTAAAKERAAAHIAAYDAARGEGALVARVGDELVDGHSAAKARQVVSPEP